MPDIIENVGIISGPLSEPIKITGTIKGFGSISGSISVSTRLSGSIVVPEQIEAERYTGPYHVVPKFNSQTLETADKHMKQNVNVEAIPVSVTENLAGGNTIYIGG